MRESLQKNFKAICLMLVCAACLCVGQIFWKMSADDKYNLTYLVYGFAVYGVGSVAMIAAYSMGELSMLQPINSINLVVSMFVAHFVFDERIKPTQMIGICVIMAGVVLIGGSSRGEG